MLQKRLQHVPNMYGDENKKAQKGEPVKYDL